MSGTILPVVPTMAPPAVASRPQPKRPAQVAPSSRAATIAIIIGITLFAIMAVELLLGGLFGGRYLPGVSVAGQSLAGLTRPQARHLLETKVDRYRMRLDVGAQHYNLSPAEAGINYELDATLDQAYLIGRQHGITPWSFVEAHRRGGLAYAYRVDRVAQKELVARIVAASGKAPVDATIVVSGGTPSVQADQNGFDLSPSEVERALDTTVAAAETRVETLTPSTHAARISSADAAKALDATKALLAVPVTVTYHGKTFRPTAAQRDNWLAFPASTSGEPALTPTVDINGVKSYLATVAKAVNTKPTDRQVMVMDGNQTEVSAGKNGVQLNADALAASIAGAVAAKQPLVAEAPTSEIPFQTAYNHSVALPYARYIEINLSVQHLWVYQDHQIIFDSPITSGATGAGFPTAQGTFAIFAKQTDRHLVGYQYGPAYNYDVFVHYWMPFYQGYGLHDASWRHGKFGGQDYYYGGSHGCVNLPDATAAWLYNWAAVGTTVWVHG